MLNKEYFFIAVGNQDSLLKPNIYGPLGNILVMLLIAGTFSVLSAQQFNLGIPPIENYHKKDYGAGNQNRGMTFSNGRLYSPNNGGLLTYDGVKWEIHQTPQNSILRSQATSAGDTIFVGGQGELGYFHPDATGHLQYKSILDLLPDQFHNPGEVWDMAYHQGKLYIRIQWNQILEISLNGPQNTFIHEKHITKLTKIGDEVWYHIKELGSFRIKNGVSSFFDGSTTLKNLEVKEFLPYGNSTVAVTERAGLFMIDDVGEFQPWKTNVDDLLSSATINCATVSKDKHLIIGTQKAGILIIDDKGLLKMKLTKESGLQSNTVSSLCISESGSLWAAVGNGIDFINLNSTVQKFHPDGNLEGAVYDIDKWRGHYWFATTNGLYRIKERDYYNPDKDNEYTLVAGSQGQTWRLKVINDQLFCGHHDGGFTMDDDLKLKWLISDRGVWTFEELNANTIAAGTYQGIKLIERKNNEWKTSMTVSGLTETSRVILYDSHQNLWVSHPYKKVYKIRFSDDYKTSTIKEYDKDNGFQTNLRNYVYELNGECYLTNETGVYKYNNTEDNFSLAKPFTKDYPAGNYLRSIVSKNKTTWAIANSGTANISLLNKNLTTKSPIYISTDENYIGGFENLYPLDSTTLLTCSDHGVNMFSQRVANKKIQAPKLHSALLEAKSDSLIYASYGKATPQSFNSKHNALRFDFATLDSKSNPIAYYRHMLVGQDEDWSEWTVQNTKEYYHLQPGNYEFMVRSVAPDGSEGPITNYKFEIKTPWTKSWWAYLLYTIGVLLLVLLLLLIPRKKYQENTSLLEAKKAEAEAGKKAIEIEKTKIEEEKKIADREIIEAQRKMELLEKEKLESEILFKNKELAMSTMNILQKNETLDAIRSKIEQIENRVSDKEARKEIRSIVGLLRGDDRLEDDWTNFSIHFDQAHHDFLKRLKATYPKLTPKDQKLSAYLRMNLTTKEIAPLLKISVRGVEISRYRLRKKLELSKEENLNEFMMGF